MHKNFSSENRALCKRNCQERRRPRQDTDENIIRRMRFACWINKARAVQLVYVTRLVLHSNKGYAKSLHVTFLRILPVWSKPLACNGITILNVLRTFLYPDCATSGYEVAENHTDIESGNNLHPSICRSVHISEVQSERKPHMTATFLQMAPYSKSTSDNGPQAGDPRCDFLCYVIL
jgi:hypothetical protein